VMQVILSSLYVVSSLSSGLWLRGMVRMLLDEAEI
jgi:hypothetical protein